MTHLVQIAMETPLPAPLEAAWLRALPDARRRELMDWPDAPARHRSLIGRRLLLRGLKHFGFPANALANLRYAGHGKPALDLPVEFSLSHCAGRVLCALSTAGPVGVDVEPIGELTAAEFRNYLSDEERAWAGEDPRRFCVLWTRKEAIVKAAGTQGLAAMHEVRIDRDQATHAGNRWHTAPIDVGRGHCAHVATAGPFASPPDARRVTIRNLCQLV